MCLTNGETNPFWGLLSILSVLAAAFVASYLTHRFAINQRENEKINALRTWVLIVVEELNYAQEMFKRYHEANSKVLRKELVTVEATGYEGLKTNGLVDIIPGEIHSKIYKFYLILTSINSTALSIGKT